MADFSSQRLLERHVKSNCDWTAEKTILYALGVGASELDFIYEDRLVALPTMATVIGYPGHAFWSAPDLGIDTFSILHGSTSVELHRQLPTEGEIFASSKIAGLWDKGAAKGAVTQLKRELTDQTGAPIATVVDTILLRGDGDFGGSTEGMPPAFPRVPGNEPDISVTFATLKQQAAIYRLSGDLNPLHIDPAIALHAGFEQPILHGLCSFGIAGRAIVQGFCGNEPWRIRRIGARFARPVLPGDTIATEIWRISEHQAAFRARVLDRNTIALDNGYVELFSDPTQ